MILEAEASLFLNFPTSYNKGGTRIFKITNFFNALLRFVSVFLQLFDLKCLKHIKKNH